MSTAELEKRVTALERAVADLQSTPRRVSPIPPKQWLQQITGTFSSPQDRAALEEAMRYGRQWREAQRPKSNRRKASKR